MADKNNSHAEFLRLFTVHQPRVFGYVMSMVGDWHDAEEVVQEASVRAWESFDDFERGTNFGAWLHKIAYHQVLALRKRNARSPLLMSDAFLDAIGLAHERLAGELSQQVEALVQCVERLRPRDRDLVDRCYAVDAKMKDVAVDLERPPGTVYKQLTRIRRTLLACVERRMSAEERN